MKVVVMRESKDFSKMTTQEIFSDLKAYEFELDRRSTDGHPCSFKAIDLTAAESNRRDIQTESSRRDSPTENDINKENIAVTSHFE